MSPLAILRRIVHPTGQHRRVDPVVPLAELLRPTEVLCTDEAWCPVQQQTTLHAFLHTGGRVCWTCRHHTPGGAQ